MNPPHPEPHDPGRNPGDNRATERATEQDLWDTYNHATGDTKTNAEDALTRAYLPIIRIVMGRRALPDALDREDLAGYLGERLIKAIRTWDPTRATFPTYATSQLTFGVSEYMREQDPLSRHHRAIVRTVQTFVHDWHRDHGEDPTTPTIAQATGLTLDEVQAAFEHYAFTLPGSLDDNPNADSLGIDPSDFHSGNADITDDRVIGLINAMADLTTRDRRILLLYWFEKLTLAQIGEIFSVTEGRISQVHTRALALMRAHIIANKDQ